MDFPDLWQAEGIHFGSVGMRSSCFVSHRSYSTVGGAESQSTKRKCNVYDSEALPSKVPKVENPDLDGDNSKTIVFPEFEVDESGYVHVYTDGACENNGKVKARAGIGVWFADNHPL
jgi:hypothetical protein